jgi:hypothetical protein
LEEALEFFIPLRGAQEGDSSLKKRGVFTLLGELKKGVASTIKNHPGKFTFRVPLVPFLKI